MFRVRLPLCQLCKSQATSEKPEPVNANNLKRQRSFGHLVRNLHAEAYPHPACAGSSRPIRKLSHAGDSEPILIMINLLVFIDRA